MAARPAWAKESIFLRLDQPVTLNDLSPEWAFEGATGAGVRVAVVDSGIDFDHPMLDGCVDTEGSIEFTIDADGAVQAVEGKHMDAYGHGTACAGIIHAMAPKATLTSVRVLGPGLTGKAAAFHAGLLWAVEQGFDIINLSLGTTKKDWALAFHEVCDRAYFGNSFIVTAANNIARASYPSLFASVASVACNTTTDPWRFHANPEPPTEFLARGIDVEVPWLEGGTTVTTGNSFAAPHIAGLAALIKSKHPELRPFQLKAALWATSANVREAGEIEPAGRRRTVFSTGYRGTSHRMTTARTNLLAGTARATVGRAPTPVDRQSPEHAVDEGVGALAASLPDVVVGIDVIERGPGGVLRRGSMRADGLEVFVLDLSGLDVDVIHRAVVRLNVLAGLSVPNVERIMRVITDPVPTVVTLDSGAVPLLTTVAPVQDAAEVPAARESTGRERAIALVLSAADVLATLHRADFVHGDLGPGDFCTDRESRFLLGGLVRSSVAPGASMLAAGRSVNIGTLQNLAREQLEGRSATFASDVHSLGFFASRLLAGRLPYPAVERVGDLLRQRMGSEPEAMLSLAPDLSPAIAGVLDIALRTAPAERYSNAEEFASALRMALVS